MGMKAIAAVIISLLVIGCGDVGRGEHNRQVVGPVGKQETQPTSLADDPPGDPPSTFSSRGVEISHERWVFKAERIEGGATKRAINAHIVLKGPGGQEIRIEADEVTGVLEGNHETATLKTVRVITDSGLDVFAEGADWIKEENRVVSDRPIRGTSSELSVTAEGFSIQFGGEFPSVELIRPKITLRLQSASAHKEGSN